MILEPDDYLYLEDGTYLHTKERSDEAWGRTYSELEKALKAKIFASLWQIDLGENARKGMGCIYSRRRPCWKRPKRESGVFRKRDRSRDSDWLCVP